MVTTVLWTMAVVALLAGAGPASAGGCLAEASSGEDVVIAAASPWAKRREHIHSSPPSNVTFQKFTQYDLRQLYADCALLVMPLQDVKFQAGVTAILESLAMGKTVICSRVPGQTDVLVEDQTGRYVPAGDAVALRDKICQLLAQPEEAARMGQNGRLLVEQEMSLEQYVKRLTGILQQAIVEGKARRPGEG